MALNLTRTGLAELRSKRSGLRDTQYLPSGDTYTGEWLNDKRHGKGTHTTKDGFVYEGDWTDGKREGFGVVSRRVGDKSIKVYSGTWKSDKKHGRGVEYYENGDHYEGEWHEGERSGWGRMYYADKSIFEGEWLDGKRNGVGLLLLPNGNRYEGSWEDDLKHGQGKLFYLDKGQVYIGTWSKGAAKCGEFVDLDRNKAPQATPFPIPELGLANPAGILNDAARKAVATP